MQKALKIFWCLLLLTACQPNEKKASPEINRPENADSATVVLPDGVAVKDPVLTQTDEIPPVLVQQLDRHYPGWKTPQLSDGYKKMLGLTGKNVIWVTGDFDQNQQPDYAAQIQLRDSVYVTTFLQQKNRDTFNHHLLEKNPVYTWEDQKGMSLYYLGFLAKNDSVYNYRQERKVKLPSDAVTVGMEYGINTYYYQNGNWQRLETGD